MQSFDVQAYENGAVVVVVISGYFTGEAGEAVNNAVEKYVLAGKIRFLMDFSKCTLINSPGVASLLDISMKIVDDFKGRLVLCGLDQMKWTVLKMVRIIPLAETARDIQEGLQIANKDNPT